MPRNTLVLMLTFMLVSTTTIAVVDLSTTTASAASFGDFEYTLINGGTAVEITGYTGSGGSVTVPNIIAGVPVTSLGSYSFSYNDNITSLALPVSISNIGSEAFMYSSKLTSLTIPKNVVKIGDEVFYGCSSLTSINVDQNNQKYSSIDGVLYNNTKTTLIAYPAAKSGPFTIPNTVTRIGDCSFVHCEELTAVTIPSSVTTIGELAFYECTSLITVTIPSSVSFIDTKAFMACSDLTAINVDQNNQYYAGVNGALYNKSLTALIECPCGVKGTFQVPNTVTLVGVDAFACCAYTSVIVPDSVTRIEQYAFLYCNSMKNVTLGKNVSSIGGGAFEGCSALTSITFMGNAPASLETGWVTVPNAGLTVYYEPNATGFTTPTWQGLATKVIVQQSQGTNSNNNTNSTSGTGTNNGAGSGDVAILLLVVLVIVAAVVLVVLFVMRRRKFSPTINEGSQPVQVPPVVQGLSGTCPQCGIQTKDEAFCANCGIKLR